MRGSIFGVVTLAIGLVMTPLIIPESYDETGDTIMSIVGWAEPVLGVSILMAVAGLLIALYTDSI